MPALLINGADAKAIYGFSLVEAPAWSDLPPQNIPTQPVIGRQGSVVTAAPIEGSDQITLRGVVTSTSVAATRTLIDNLKLALMASLVQLTFEDYATRYVTVALLNFTVQWQGPALIERKLRVEIRLLCVDPYSYDITPTSVAAATAMPLGTGYTRPTITLTATGAVSAPNTLNFRNNDGTFISSMVINVALATSDVLIVDNDARTVKKNGASALNLITSGDFFTADPANHYVAGVGPKFDAVTNATMAVAYKKSWR
jgi:hypothetical protein